MEQVHKNGEVEFDIDPLPLEVQPLIAKGMRYGGNWHNQWVYYCPNEYGLSVVEGSFAYCSARNDRDNHGTYEVALVHWDKDATDFRLVYAPGTPFAHDVQGWQSIEDIARLLLIAGQVTEHTSLPHWPDEEDWERRTTSS